MSRWATPTPAPIGPPELERLRRLAWIFDECFRVPVLGVRFGVDAVVGLLPGIGDAIGGAFPAWGSRSPSGSVPRAWCFAGCYSTSVPT